MWDGTVSGIEFQAESMAFLALWNSADATSRQHWQWKPWADSTAGGYLTLEDVPTSTASSDSGGQQWAERHCLSDSANSPAIGSDYGGDSADAATLVVDPVFNNQHTSFTYHVIYSESYNVPTLFFRGFHSDGSALNMEEVKRILTADSLLLLEKSPWTFLTQEEHPILHRPWLSFHPCGTSKVMALILSDWLRFHQEINTDQQRQPLSPQAGTSLPDVPKASVLVEGNLLQFKPSSFPAQYLLAWLSVVGQVARLDLPLSLFKKQPRVS
ncbi:unnamed protein product [Calypogeia fissa]